MIINNHFAMCLNFNINRHQKIIMAIARTTPSRRFLFIFFKEVHNELSAYRKNV